MCTLDAYFLKVICMGIIFKTDKMICFSAESGGKASKEFWMLKDPPARPHIEAPPSVPTLPANQVTSVTRVTVPSVHNCDEGSKLCIIL